MLSALVKKVVSVFTAIIAFFVSLIGGNVNVPPVEPVGELLDMSTTEIVSEYTEVVNQLKLDAPGYAKIEYQEIPDEYFNAGAVGNILKRLAEGYTVSEQDAEKRMLTAGDSSAMPIYSNEKGCLPLDISAVKFASCEALDNGMYRITITLNDEANPEPADSWAETAPSAHGAMFNPLSRSDIDRELENISVITVNSMNLNYTDCTSVIVYDPDTKQVDTWKQTMNVDAEADIKAAILSVNVAVRLVDVMSISDIDYAS